jgi:hypothetical protein
MAIIKTPVAGVSPYQEAAVAPVVLKADANGNTVLANPNVTATAAAATNANVNVVVNGAEALNSLIATSRSGVFEGANVTINLEEQQFNTTNQVTSTTNYPSGSIGEIQYNSGSNSFASSAYFTYTSGNVVTPGIRTDGYFYSNGAPFISGGNAAIGNFVFTGDTMSIAHANSTLSVTGNGTGNVNITANGNTWTFGANGNLTLPGNTFAVKYANGNPVVISGGATLPLANGTSNINIATANGNVTLTANGNTWTFGTTGTTQFPGNLLQPPEGNPLDIKVTTGNVFSTVSLYDTASQLIIQDNNTGANPAWALFEADLADVNTPTAVVILKPGDTGTEVRWTFNADGNTVFPTLSVQRGDTTSGQITGQTLLFGDYANEAIISTPNGVAPYWPDSQRLVINPGEGLGSGEGGDIYLWAGRGGNASGSGGDIKIRGGQGGAGTAGGNGGDGGYIRIEGGNAATTATPGGAAGWIEITAGAGGENRQGGYIEITAGQGGNEVDAFGGGDANITGGFGTNYGRGGNVNLTGGISANGLPYYGNVNIAAGAGAWHFNNDGNLVLPHGGSITEGTAVVPGGSANTITLTPSSGGNADQQLLIYPTAGEGNHLHLTSGNLYNTELYLGSDDLYVKLGSNGNVYVNANDSLGNIAQWSFSPDGNLTTPGASGDITGANVISANVFTAPGNVTISADGNSWTFGQGGNVTFPTGMHIDDEGANTRISQNDGYLKMTAGNTASFQAGWAEFENTGTGSEALIIANGNAVGYLGNLVVKTGNQSSTTYTWTFDSNGDLFTSGDIFANGIVQTAVYVASTIPTASSVGAGSRAFVTDADSKIFANLYVGSAGNSVPVWTDGANWYIG